MRERMRGVPRLVCAVSAGALLLSGCGTAVQSGQLTIDAIATAQQRSAESQPSVRPAGPSQASPTAAAPSPTGQPVGALGLTPSVTASAGSTVAALISPSPTIPSPPTSTVRATVTGHATATASSERSATPGRSATPSAGATAVPRVSPSAAVAMTASPSVARATTSPDTQPTRTASGAAVSSTSGVLSVSFESLSDIVARGEPLVAVIRSQPAVLCTLVITGQGSATAPLFASSKHTDAHGLVMWDWTVPAAAQPPSVTVTVQCTTRTSDARRYQIVTIR